MIGKRYALPADAIGPLATGHGGCIATDAITVDGLPVRFMYREAPDNDADSGWRFTSGVVSDACMEDPENHGIFDVNTIATYDPSIIPFWMRQRAVRSRSAPMRSRLCQWAIGSHQRIELSRGVSLGCAARSGIIRRSAFPCRAPT